MYSITLQTDDTAVASGDILGRLQFAASAESDGGASHLVGPGILGMAEGSFNDSSNPASLVFCSSEADANPAKPRLKLSHEGHILPISGSYNIGDSANRFNIVYSTGVNSAYVELSSAVPSDTSNKLYNDNGTLKFNGSSIANGMGGGLLDVIDDSTPQLGGYLDLNGYDINGNGNLDINGDISATHIYADFLGIGVSSQADSHKLQVADGHVVFNESGGDYDFRIESAGNQNMFYLDAGLNAVGIGTSTPSGILHLRQSSSPSLRIHASSSAGNSTARASRGNILFPSYTQAYEHVKLTSWGREGSFLAGMLGIDISNSAGVSSEVLTIDNQSTASTFGLRTYNIPLVTTSGNVIFNETGGNYDFRVEGNSNENVLVVDASVDSVGIRTSTPTQALDIRYPEAGGMALIKSTDSNDGLLFGDMAYSVSNAYQGMKHVSMIGTSDYMIMSAGTDNHVSAKAGSNLYLRAGGNSTTSQILLTSSEISINDFGANCDFRVEGDTDTNLLFVDASVDAIGIGTNSPTEKLDINSDAIRIRTAQTPASATALGKAGDICWDSNYIYVCVATNTWKRSALSTWP